VGYLRYCHHVISPPRRDLFLFAAFCVLEQISYARKDGQFLRWDGRSGKARGAGFSKGDLPPFREAIGKKLVQHHLFEQPGLYQSRVRDRTTVMQRCHVTLPARRVPGAPPLLRRLVPVGMSAKT
jgi:hypothetical protein